MKPKQYHQPRHQRESDTVILSRHPIIRAIVDRCLDKAESIIVVAISAAIAGGIGSCNHAQIASTDAKVDSTVQWVGDHLNNKQSQIDELKAGKENK
jgi:hypothetical protein